MRNNKLFSNENFSLTSFTDGNIYGKTSDTKNFRKIQSQSELVYIIAAREKNNDAIFCELCVYRSKKRGISGLYRHFIYLAYSDESNYFVTYVNERNSYENGAAKLLFELMGLHCTSTGYFSAKEYFVELCDMCNLSVVYERRER